MTNDTKQIYFSLQYVTHIIYVQKFKNDVGFLMITVQNNQPLVW